MFKDRNKWVKLFATVGMIIILYFAMKDMYNQFINSIEQSTTVFESVGK